MKKLFIIALLIITTSCTLFNQEEKFVNPLFYKKMMSGSLSPWNVEITPNTYYTEHGDFPGEGITYQCELVENTETKVILKCFEPFDEKTKQWLKENRPGVFDDKDGIYRYYEFEIHLLTEEEDPFNMFYIRKFTYQEDTPFLKSSNGYVIDTPRK